MDAPPGAKHDQVKQIHAVAMPSKRTYPWLSALARHRGRGPWRVPDERLGELPVDVCSAWIFDEAQFDAANALLTAFLSGTHPGSTNAERWSCHTCGEELEGQFTACWACGTAKA